MLLGRTRLDAELFERSLELGVIKLHVARRVKLGKYLVQVLERQAARNQPARQQERRADEIRAGPHPCADS